MIWEEYNFRTYTPSRARKILEEKAAKDKAWEELMKKIAIGVFVVGVVAFALTVPAIAPFIF